MSSVKFLPFSRTGIACMAVFLLAAACRSKPLPPETMKTPEPATGTFAYDLAFLNKHKQTVVLSDSLDQARLVIVPDWQARVMTSTANGDQGFSFGWINYPLIGSGQKSAHFNAFGGEERLWLGPEGGPFSLYFAKGQEQIFKNWYVPAILDTMGFDLMSRSNNHAGFSKLFKLVNYAGTTLDIGLERYIDLLDATSYKKVLGFDLPDSIKSVAYQSVNIITNRGTNAWTRKTGMPSIWMLSMLTPSPQVTIFIPYRTGPEKQLGTIVHSDYFGKIPDDRLIVDKGMIYLRADGNFRSKIGIPPRRALKYAGSYDAKHKSLTVLWCDMPENRTDYVNSKWGPQQDPFSGDAINAYNDGPVEDGTQMGPFYELESSSPAAQLSPGKKLIHRQIIFHFQGSEHQLSEITEKIFGISLDKIKSKFK